MVKSDLLVVPLKHAQMLDLDHIAEHEEVVLAPCMSARTAPAEGFAGVGVAGVDPPHVVEQIRFVLMDGWMACLQQTCGTVVSGRIRIGAAQQDFGKPRAANALRVSGLVLASATLAASPAGPFAAPTSTFTRATVAALPAAFLILPVNEHLGLQLAKKPLCVAVEHRVEPCRRIEFTPPLHFAEVCVKLLNALAELLAKPGFERVDLRRVPKRLSVVLDVLLDLLESQE